MSEDIKSASISPLTALLDKKAAKGIVSAKKHKKCVYKPVNGTLLANFASFAFFAKIAGNPRMKSDKSRIEEVF